MQQKPTFSARTFAMQKYASARSNLLLMVALTAINVILLALGSEMMMLFSATVPYIAVVFGIAGETSASLIVGIGVAVVILTMYGACWLLSKKHYGFMVAAMVLFILDTISMAFLYLFAGEVSGILDVIFHVWVLYYLIIGVKNGAALSRMPAEETEEQYFDTQTVQTVEADTQSVPQNGAFTPYPADNDVKGRVLLETDWAGYHIQYRRVKNTNQLIVNDYVYDEVKMMVEPAHQLTAQIGENTIVAGFDGVINSYIDVNGERIATKKRFY